MQASKILVALTVAAGFASASFAQSLAVPATPAVPAAKVASTAAAAEQKVDAAKAGLHQAEAVKAAVQKPEVAKTEIVKPGVQKPEAVKVEAPKADAGAAADTHAKGKAVGKKAEKHANNGLHKAKGAKEEIAKGEVKPAVAPATAVTLPAAK